MLVVSSAEVYGVVSPGAAAAGRGHADGAGDAVCRQQAGRGGGGPAGVAGVRPAGDRGAARSTTSGPDSRPTSPCRLWPSASWRLARSGRRSLRVGTLTTRRDFTDVRDVVVAYRLLVRHGAPGTIYNVCSGRDVAISEVAEKLLALAHADLELVTDPELVRPVDVPVLRGDAGPVALRLPAGPPPSPSRQRSPTSWPRGRRTTGERCLRDVAVG